jgi:hypothetical protein
MFDKTALVITSIFNPTVAIRKFAKTNFDKKIVVGDVKTPSDWKCDGFDFLSIKKQSEIFPKLAQHLPFNHYSRKNLGYLYAKDNYDYKYIYDTDDDNIPYMKEFSALNSINTIRSIQSDEKWVNIYNYFGSWDFPIWPRGFPLDEISKAKNYSTTNNRLDIEEIAIWQGLADLDPDLDAIHRLVINKEIKFEKKDPILIEPGQRTPINSQNTFFRADLFKCLYLPHSVSFRFTDILRGYIANAICDKYSLKIGAFSPTVYQLRNTHNLMHDLESELVFLKSANDIYELILNCVSEHDSIEDNLWSVYEDLVKEGYVKHHELTALEIWLNKC